MRVEGYNIIIMRKRLISAWNPRVGKLMRGMLALILENLTLGPLVWWWGVRGRNWAISIVFGVADLNSDADALQREAWVRRANYKLPKWSGMMSNSELYGAQNRVVKLLDGRSGKGMRRGEWLKILHPRV